MAQPESHFLLTCSSADSKCQRDILPEPTCSTPKTVMYYTCTAGEEFARLKGCLLLQTPHQVCCHPVTRRLEFASSGLRTCLCSCRWVVGWRPLHTGEGPAAETGKIRLTAAAAAASWRIPPLQVSHVQTFQCMQCSMCAKCFGCSVLNKARSCTSATGARCCAI